MVTVRWNSTHVSILCPLGHQITARDYTNLAGSLFQAEAVEAQHGRPSIWDEASRTCDGLGHARREGSK